jgi:hypothetical protein
MQRHQELFWRNEPDISFNVSSAKLRELQDVPWKPVTDVRDWKELIQKKNLHSTRASVKICANSADPRVATNDEVRHGFITVVNPSLIQVKASRALDRRVTDTSSQSSTVHSATNPTNSSSSLHVGPRDANLEVLAVRGVETQSHPQIQAFPIPLAPVPPNGHTHGSKVIAATAPSPPMPMPMPTMPMPSVSPPAPAHARASPIAATPHPMTQSPSPLLGRPSKPLATLEPQKNVSSPRAPATPRLSPGTNPSSKPVGIANPNLPTQPHPQPASKNVKPAPKQIRNTKVDKPVQDVRGATKSTISISTFTHMFKPASMPGAFPGPEMDVDWVTVSHGPADSQGGNWLKRLFHRPG